MNDYHQIVGSRLTIAKPDYQMNHALSSKTSPHKMRLRSHVRQVFTRVSTLVVLT